MHDSESTVISNKYNPWKIFFWTTFIVVIVVVSIAISFEVNQSYDKKGEEAHLSKTQQIAFRTIKTRFKQKLDALKIQNNKLRVDVARMESVNRINGHAYKIIKGQLSLLTIKIQKLRKDNQFYRYIVAPKKSAPGVRIHGFKIDQGVKRRQYHYHLTLIQNHGLKNRRRKINGIVKIYVLGKRLDGSRKVLSFKNISSGTQTPDMKFSFMDFRSFEGKLDLPNGFNPLSIWVQVIPNRRTRNGRRRVEKKFRWAISTTKS